MKKYFSSSEEETREIAKKFAQNLGKIHVIGLEGELGAGKTVFVQGFAKGLKIKDKIISPTFVLIRQHKIPNSKKILYHIDLYRLENGREIKEVGIDEIISNSNNIILIEWAEKIKNLLPKNTLRIFFNVIDRNSRRISFLGKF